MENCIFCKIITGEIPSAKVYEDDNSVAFLDIHPVVKGHTLLIPKAHHAWMHETPDELIKKMFVDAKKLMLVMKDTMPCDYVQISVVGKDVPHFHIHLIPRYFTDTLHGWETISYKDGELLDTAKKLRGATV